MPVTAGHARRRRVVREPALGTRRHPAAAATRDSRGRPTSCITATRRSTSSRSRALSTTRRRTRQPPRLFVCPPRRPATRQDSARRGVLRARSSRLARRAYRRPVTEQDLRRCSRSIDAGSARGRIRGRHPARRAAHPGVAELPVPHRARAGESRAGPGVYRLNDIDLASRLSFFLWSSIPDDELLDAATRGTLSTRPCSSSRCGGCSPTGDRRRSSTTSRASG